MIEQLLITVLIGRHCLITGLPGTAKTLMVRGLAQALGLQFKRIQFTPDLMPADVTGTDILDEDPASGARRWRFEPGPVFTNVLLADEINRTPPKTQSALLEAMQEASVTARGQAHGLERPFVVLATQNPIELEGTYPLPEAQLDRFVFNVLLDYLDAGDEVTVVDRNVWGVVEEDVPACTDAASIVAFQGLVRQVPVADAITRYAVDLVRATRPDDATARRAGPRLPGLWGERARRDLPRPRRPARVRCCGVATTSPSMISARWRRRCCAIACRRTISRHRTA